ncbi:MAG: DUF4097 family beta strand repeat protein [Clostridiales bacterium]|nr:DUF4097 family beta strand repeat protein [Clostridiales bacterium]
MDKITYLAELAEGLARWVPERERQDILRYYAEYFEEAGPEREAEVIKELGDPWALSSRLAVEGGFVAQEQAVSWTPPKKKKWPWVLAICAVVAVALMGSLVTALVGLGRYVFNNVAQTPVQTVDVATIVDGATGEEYAYSFADEAIPGVVVYGQEDEESFGGFWSMEDGDLALFDSIDVEIGLGSVTVSPGPDYALFIDHEGDLGSYKVTWEVKDGTLKIRSSGSSSVVSGWDGVANLFSSGGSMNVSVDITVPEEALLEKLSVETGVGSVNLSDVTAEKVTVDSGTGSVKCYDPRQAASVKMHSGTGSVTLQVEEPCRGAEIELESGTGSINVILGCSEQDCEYKLETGTGKVRINNESQGHEAKRKGNALYKLEAESGTGSVNVDFTQD